MMETTFFGWILERIKIKKLHHQRKIILPVVNGKSPVIDGHELQFAEVSQPGGGQFDEVAGVHHFG